MAMETATIRVSRKTRDLLAQQARTQGKSVAAMLADIAREQEIEAMFAAEREARRLDELNPEALAEMRLWEGTLEDGIDFDDGLTVD
jgi:hypothetical protein